MFAPRDKLELLKSLSGRVKSASEYFDSVKVPSKSRSAISFKELFPRAKAFESEGMTCHRLETRAPLDGSRFAEGYACPAGTGAWDSASAQALGILGRDPKWLEIPPESIAFLDIETTSLSGGSGTYAFLVGIGRFQAGQFVVRQFFMNDYSEEPALLAAIEDELSSASALASYNGRGFDEPILRTRWRMNRREPNFPALHLDLLHPARRLWKRRLPDCRLATIERDIFRMMRFSDVESAAIPQIYFDYVRGVRRERMIPVLDHHAQDIFTLGALFKLLIGAMQNPADPRFNHASDQMGLSRMFQSSGRMEASIQSLERALLAARDPDLEFRLAMHLARGYVRAGRIAEAETIWLARVAECRAERLDPLIELAKHDEHRTRNYRRAMQWIENAEKLITSPDAKSADDLRRRRERLERKLRS